MVTTIAQAKLPASFTSVYRLFLRTSSASVLHHRPATRNLRQLWRPTFDAAARVIRDLQVGSESLATLKEKENWLRIWERRIDNTLALLYTSSKSRGLPHRITRNLGLMVLGERQRLNNRRYKVWSPDLPLTSPLYSPHHIPSQKERSKQEKLDQWDTFDANAWAPLTQVVKMAEARHGLSLGRVMIKRRITRLKK